MNTRFGRRQWIADEQEVRLGDRIRECKSDELERMESKPEKSLGSSHVEVGGGAVRHLDHLERRRSDQLPCERPLGSPHVEVGGSAV
jgi:hypothetical protein